MEEYAIKLLNKNQKIYFAVYLDDKILEYIFSIQ